MVQQPVRRKIAVSNFDPDYKFMEQRISQIRLMNIPPMGKASSIRGKFVGEGGGREMN